MSEEYQYRQGVKVPVNSMEPTMNFRWVARDGRRVLQQKFDGIFPTWDTEKGYGYDDIKSEWRDVPIENDQDGDS